MTVELTPQAKARLLVTSEVIATHPEHFNMGNWCGTTCCIAGHLVALFPPEFMSRNPGYEFPKARVILGLDNPEHYHELHELFLPGQGQLIDLELIEEDLEELPPTIAVAAIRHFVNSGVVDWAQALWDVENETVLTVEELLEAHGLAEEYTKAHAEATTSYVSWRNEFINEGNL